MTIYVILLLWVITCSLAEPVIWKYGESRYISGRAVCLILSFGAIWLISALRASTVGTDTSAYTLFYIKSAASSLEDILKTNNPLFLGKEVISWLLGYISSAAPMYVIWTSTVTAIGFGFFVWKTSPKIWLSVFLFLTLGLFFQSMNAARQYVGLGLSLIAVVYFHRSLYSPKGWVLFLLAVWIHNVSLTFLPVIIGIWLVKHCHSYRFLYGVSTIASLSFIIIFKNLAYFFAILFPHYVGYVNGAGDYNLFQENTSGRMMALVYTVFLFFLIMYYSILKNEKGPSVKRITDSFIPGAIFGTLIGLAFFSSSLVNRICWTYNCLFLAIIPYTIINLKKNTRALVALIMMALFIACYLRLAYVGNSGVVPYQIWL